MKEGGKLGRGEMGCEEGGYGGGTGEKGLVRRCSEGGCCEEYSGL